MTTRGNWKFLFASLHLDLPVAQTLKLSVNVGLIQVLTSVLFPSSRRTRSYGNYPYNETRSHADVYTSCWLQLLYFIKFASNNYNFCIFLTILEINWYWFCIIKKIFFQILLINYIINFFKYYTFLIITSIVTWFGYIWDILSLENEAFSYSIEHVDRKREIEAERRRVALYTTPGHNLNPIYSSSLRDRNTEEHVFKNISYSLTRNTYLDV